MVKNQELRRGRFFGRLVGNIPPNTYSAALARGLPSKGEMQRASIHEQYDVGTGGSASRTGDYGTGGTSGTGETGETGETGGSASRTGDYGTSAANKRLGKARKAERTGTSGTSEC